MDQTKKYPIGEIRKKRGVRRGWIKVVILRDVEGNIVDIRIGNEELDERAAGRGMIRKNRKHLKKILADGLHDCENTFDLLNQLGIESGIKIRENASEKGLGAKPDEVRLYKGVGYKKWAKIKDYNHKWLATEGIFSADKRIMGESVTTHKKKKHAPRSKIKILGIPANKRPNHIKPLKTIAKATTKTQNHATQQTNKKAYKQFTRQKNCDA